MIYFIQGKESGNIKIGYSIQPDKRINNLQTAHYEKLEVIGLLHGSMEDESNIHKMFKEYHLRGEWYSPGGKLLEFIRNNSHKKNIVYKVKEDVYQIIFAEPIKLTMSFYLNIGSFNLKIIIDNEYKFVFGVEGKRETIIDWLKNLEGLSREAMDEFISMMN